MNAFFSANTARKSFKLNQFNQAHTIKTQKIYKAESNHLSTLLPTTRLARKNISFSTYNPQAQGRQEREIFFSATSDSNNLKSQSHSENI